MQNTLDNLPSERNPQIVKKEENHMNRFHVRTVAVLLIVAFASMGTLLLTDNFVPQAHADDGCAAAAAACAQAITDAIDACRDGIDIECILAIVNAIELCAHAWEECGGGG